MKMSTEETPNWSNDETQLIPEEDILDSTNTTTTTNNTNSSNTLAIDDTSNDNESSQDQDQSEEKIDEEEPDPEDEYIDPSSFPLLEMTRLDEMISNPRWVVPVLPGGQLEVLLDASINLCRRGLDVQSPPCQRFFRDGLTTSFNKILTDDAVSSWKPEIHKCIRSNSERLVELIVLKLNQDWFPLLELLAVLFNPSNKFHQFNANRPPESYSIDTPLADDDLFARPIDNRLIKGWLVDLINRFGSLGGFQILKDRFTCETPLSVPLVFALLKPFGQCAEFLTKHTIQKYFVPIFTAVPQFLENLTDDDLKKETAKSDVISSIIKFLKCLHNRLAESEESLKNLELFRLRMILRMLQVSSFNGKMNALNEINQVIQNVQTYHPHHYHHHHRLDEIEYLTGKRIAEWISENQVLQIVLRDSLHQPQYVEKLEKILRFIIKEKTLKLKDLDDIWAAQIGKHDAIVKNLHDLLAKLAWDFSPEQLDHLFECFQASWTTTNKRQREKLLELIRRLAEDDKDGAMAHKALTLFWTLARSNELPTEIMDQALTAHVKVLDYSCSQRDNQKFQWLLTSMTHLQKNDVDWVIPAMKHMREIFSLYPEGNSNHKNSSSVFRSSIINKMQNDKQLIIVCAESLHKYMEKVRAYIKDKGACDPYHELRLDGRYAHVDQVRERLHFLRYLLKEGRLYLCEDQAYLIWQSLAENPAFNIDREMCFDWFSKLMGEEPDLDPKFTQTFFEKKVLSFDATLMTESGMNCFEKFFKHVNTAKKKLSIKRDETLMEDADLIGTDYIWKIILFGKEDMATRAIVFLRSIFTQLGTSLLPKQKEVHEDFLSDCFDRLKASYDTMLVLEKDKDSTNRVRQEVTKTCRVLRVLYEYIVECDSEYGDERAFVPMYRAYRGRNFSIYIRFPVGNSQTGRGFEDVELLTHCNETLSGLRRQIIRKFKETFQVTTTFKMDLFYSGDVLSLSDDRTTVASWGLRDKMMLQAKVIYNNATNSPDSSEESSGGSPSHYPNGFDGTNIESEEALPAVMISMDERRMEFICQLCGLGSSLGEERLREQARQLLCTLPPCRYTEKALRNAFLNQTDKKPYNIFFNTDPATVLYRLEVLYASLFPASMWDAPQTIQLLQMFFASGGASAVVEMLTKNNFMPLADMNTKRTAYLSVLRLTKAVLTILIQLLIKYESENKVIGAERLNVIVEASKTVPNPLSETILRRVSEIVSHKLLAMMKDTQNPVPPEALKELLKAAINGSVPDMETGRIIIKLALATASGSFSYFSADQHNANREPTEDDISVCEDALEVLTLGFVLNPGALEQATNDPSFKIFVRTVLFQSLSQKVRCVALDQFYSIATKAAGNPKVLLYFVQLLFEIVHNAVRDIPHHSREVFYLLSNLLKYAATCRIHVPHHEQLLNTELEWLRQIKDYVKNSGETFVHDELLEGHITVTANLVSLLTPEKKYQIGSQDTPEETTLIQEIIEEFVFTWSKAYYDLKKSGEISSEQPVPVCSTGPSQNVMLDLLVALSTNCYPNLKLVIELLSKLFNYTNEGDSTITDWEYMPPIGSRPNGGFVGLKNAGATCYMNSVLQQLYMVENIRRGVLCIATTDSEAEEGGEDAVDSSAISRCQSESSIQESISSTSAEERKSYNICILKQMQAIFGHLALSKLQYYVPNGLWKHFRLQGEAVNLREQQDAVEFFMSLVESVDDGLKALGHEQVMSKNLGGLFSDQKICKECPHRYSKEEPFSVISVDIRNHSNLTDSLEQYVKGELLEGADAYYCERCDKKVVTVKRLCVKKLPPVLAIQLKRFEYDYERLCPIKFNDYFEFPRDLDMEPYTVSGLAKIEGEIIDDDATVLDDKIPTTYRLSGVVVHSGQASGGHYYSYISVKCADGNWRWFKFDDGDVSEIRMDDDEELKTQCFGGDYSGEVFDHILKRMSFRRQKRWWNAYILFYTQELLDPSEIATNLSKITLLSNQQKRLIVPPSIERSVVRQNIEFMHSRSQFSQEYFFFIRKLVGCNTQLVQSVIGNQLTEETENIAILSVQLATMFLFSIGFRTKKALRGNTADWFDVICHYLRCSKKVRFWFATYAIFRDSSRISEYLLECPSSEVRTTFCKLLVHLAHLSKNDGIYTPSIPMATLSRSADKNAHLYEYILEAVLNLLRRDVSEYGRHLVQYFTFFYTYANFGDEEKLHLLKFNVPSTFVLLALEEGICPPIKYQCADLGKLYQVVSTLIRSCDVSYKCQSSRQGEEILPNPYFEDNIQAPVMQLPESVYEIVSDKRFLKKLLEESYTSDDTMQLLQFLCWENINFSILVLAEILSHMGYTYTTELKSFLDVGMNILKIDDSWQLDRFEMALKGTPDDNNGLIEIITRNQQTQPKRSYLFIKLITSLMEPNNAYHQIIVNSPEHLKAWNASVDWLQRELDRRAQISCSSYAYTGTGWSPPSNEAANGSFFLERSLSAKTTLHKAHLLRVDSVETVNAENDEEISSEGEGEECSKSYFERSSSPCGVTNGSFSAGGMNNLRDIDSILTNYKHDSNESFKPKFNYPIMEDTFDSTPVVKISPSSGRRVGISVEDLFKETKPTVVVNPISAPPADSTTIDDSLPRPSPFAQWINKQDPEPKDKISASSTDQVASGLPKVPIDEYYDRLKGKVAGHRKSSDDLTDLLIDQFHELNNKNKSGAPT